jgi:hypothetical protein
LRGLTCTERSGDGRILLSDIDHGLYEQFRVDQLRSLQNYRAGRSVPEAKSAWWLGETLRNLGIPWCSGLWMLWVTGNYTAAITVVAATLRNEPQKAAVRCDIFWHMLGYADRLAMTTRLDEIVPFASIHVGKPGPDNETVEMLRVWARADGGGDVADVYRAFLGREISKSTWSLYGDMRETMVSAFAEWLEDRTYVGDEFDDRLAHAALAVAKADIPWPEHEICILVAVGNWLNSVESGLESAIFPRPLRTDLTEDDDFAQALLLDR